MSHRKRYADEDLYHLPDSGGGKHPHPASSHPPPHGKRPSFPSYTDAPDLPPKVRLLCEILATAPPPSLEPSLSDTGLSLTPADVELVLKLSYSHPGPAVTFFRWSAPLLDHRHSPYSWNLLVDLLGKNLLFDAMWDTVSSMHSEHLLSLATFASVFSSFAAAARPAEALAAFDAMEHRFSIPRDTPALNTLLSALCREGLTSPARDFFARSRRAIPPDPDTFAILLEGCETEADPAGAHHVFHEMVTLFGWDPASTPAYDSFLTTLVRSPGGLTETLKFLEVMRGKRCYPGIKFFRSALQVFVKEADSRGACAMWDALVGRNGCYPDTAMYNSMIALLCYANQIDAAYQFMDEMVMYGAFPDSQTYNVMLQFTLKGRKVRDAATIFNEMVKNEFFPTEANCSTAMKIFMDAENWELGVKVWKCMAENEMPQVEEYGNSLVLKLRDLDRTPEACRFAEDVIEKGIKLNSSTLSKLKSSLQKVGKSTLYDDILRKWKGH